MPDAVTENTSASAELLALLEQLWAAYAAITPAATRVHALLARREEDFRNDHIALRTFDLDPIGLEVLARPFETAGYVSSGSYHFEQKRLRALSYSPPSPDLPRVFISELITAQFDAATQSIIAKIVASLSPHAARSPTALLTCAPTWPRVSFADYRALLAQSEYAAWVAAFGIRANHFTVHANDLRSFDGLAQLNAFLVDHGERLNGGDQAIQGTAGAFLEQSSTVADRIPWAFAGAETHEIPSCYYEFAWRHPDASGQLFDGFVTQSADKIFESTDVAQHR